MYIYIMLDFKCYVNIFTTEEDPVFMLYPLYYDVAMRSVPRRRNRVTFPYSHSFLLSYKVIFSFFFLAKED